MRLSPGLLPPGMGERPILGGGSDRLLAPIQQRLARTLCPADELSANPQGSFHHAVKQGLSRVPSAPEPTLPTSSCPNDFRTSCRLAATPAAPARHRSPRTACRRR